MARDGWFLCRLIEGELTTLQVAFLLTLAVFCCLHSDKARLMPAVYTYRR